MRNLLTSMALWLIFFTPAFAQDSTETPAPGVEAERSNQSVIQNPAPGVEAERSNESVIQNPEPGVGPAPSADAERSNLTNGRARAATAAEAAEKLRETAAPRPPGQFRD
jgi:hypothetical protein